MKRNEKKENGNRNRNWNYCSIILRLIETETKKFEQKKRLVEMQIAKIKIKLILITWNKKTRFFISTFLTSISHEIHFYNQILFYSGVILNVPVSCRFLVRSDLRLWEIEVQSIYDWVEKSYDKIENNSNNWNNLEKKLEQHE